MTPAQRSKARARLAAFQAWISGKMGINEAVKASGLSRSRFYRLAAEWRSAPSLAALGAFTGGGSARQRLDSDAVNALQSVVADIVRLNAGASVSQLVRLMIERAGVPEDKLPGTIRLRNIVENEVRRVTATGEAGHAIRFDCTAINLPRHDGRPFVMFACIDVGTRLILGMALSEEALAAVGYPAAAEDAQRRIAAMRDRLPWALRLTRVEITAGVDIDASVALVEALGARGVRANVQLARVDRRFGRYFRASVGERIGRIAITPARTTAGLAMADNGDMSPWTSADAAAALRMAVDDYNMSILTEVSAAPGGNPPDDLVLMLNVLTQG